jgi:uncharacterized protein YndB with AHSA1/START domain
MIPTYRFGFATGAAPERVWSALTDAAATPRYLLGVALSSAWTPGAPVSFRLADMLVATGEVLAATPGEHLSLAIDGGNGPDTYLTWTIRPGRAGTGSLVGLTIDEPWGVLDRAAVEDDWLPALAELEALLAAETTLRRPAAP